ncbi:MAG: hypothetical protein U5L05_04630 [Rubrivivax sp.]|nr:hypothetical protein [Rubrivivax sp.]
MKVGGYQPTFATGSFEVNRFLATIRSARSDHATHSTFTSKTNGSSQPDRATWAKDLPHKDAALPVATA